MVQREMICCDSSLLNLLGPTCGPRATTVGLSPLNFLGRCSRKLTASKRTPIARKHATILRHSCPLGARGGGGGQVCTTAKWEMWVSGAGSSVKLVVSAGAAFLPAITPERSPNASRPGCEIFIPTIFLSLAHAHAHMVILVWDETTASLRLRLFSKSSQLNKNKKLIIINNLIINTS